MPDRTGPTTAELFVGYLPLAWKQAAKFSRFYGLPYDEVKDEAEGALALVAVDYYEERKRKPEGAGRKYASPTTWVYSKLHFHLLTFCTRKQPRECNFTTLSPGEDGHGSLDGPAPERWIDGLLHSIGSDARAVINIILSGPGELLEELMPYYRSSTEKKTRHGYAPPHKAREAVNGMLDWESDRFQAAWAEIEQAL